MKFGNIWHRLSGLVCIRRFITTLVMSYTPLYHCYSDHFYADIDLLYATAIGQPITWNHNMYLSFFTMGPPSETLFSQSCMYHPIGYTIGQRWMGTDRCMPMSPLPFHLLLKISETYLLRFSSIYLELRTIWSILRLSVPLLQFVSMCPVLLLHGITLLHKYHL